MEKGENLPLLGYKKNQACQIKDKPDYAQKKYGAN